MREISIGVACSMFGDTNFGRKSRRDHFGHLDVYKRITLK